MGVQTMNITQEQLEELIKCHKDPIYFIQTYVTAGLELDGKIFDHIMSMHKNPIAIGVFDCGVGKTTADLGYLLWQILFHYDKRCYVATRNHQESHSLMNKLNEMLNSLPSYMEPKVKIRNRNELRFESGSGVIFGSLLTVRGRKLDIIFIPDFCLYSDFQQDEMIHEIYPYLGHDSKIVITTTEVSYKDSPYSKFVLSIQSGRRKGNIVK